MTSIMPGLISYTPTSLIAHEHHRGTYLVELQWSCRLPPHSLINNRDQIADLAILLDVNLASALQSLL